MDGNNKINPLTGSQWDIDSLVENLLSVQDALLQSQEKIITLSAQVRELERQTRDAEDIRTAHDNQAQLLADKSRENKYLHQELSRLSSMLAARMQEGDELRATIAELQHQLKTSQSDRDLLAIMLTEAETAARQTSGKLEPGGKKDSTNWTRYLKGK
jgi:chromosome segregation ATPase